MLCTFVLHQLLTAVKPQITLLAGNVASYPTLIPFKQQHKFPQQPAFDICRLRCQQMNAILHVLLEDEICLEGDAADG